MGVIESMRRVLMPAGLVAAFVVSVAAGAAGAAPRAEAPVHVAIGYDLSFLNLGVGAADLTGDLARDRYALKLGGRLTGLAGWFFQGSGSAGSTGRLSPTGTVPNDFRIDSLYGGAPVRVHVVFNDGAVTRSEVEPEPAPKPDRVPVTAADRTGVTDPIGMLAVPVGPGDLAPALCDRRIPVFDGATRADLVLSRGVVVTVAAGPYRGPALDCRIRWVPVAGHRAKGSSVRRMQDNDDMRVRLAPVAGTALLLPLAISVGTGWGTARIEARSWPAVASGQAAAKP